MNDTATATSTEQSRLAFHNLEVASVRQLTADSVELTFVVPDELVELFTFEAGQHLTLRTNVDGDDVRRNYSITAPADSGRVSCAVRCIPDGVMSTHITTNVSTGDVLRVMPPTGRFTVPTDPAAKRHWLFIAAGSGITPIMSLIATVLDNELNSQVTLLFGNRTVDTIMFRDDLDALKSRYLDRLTITHFLSRETRNAELFSGRIDADRVKRLADTLLNIETVDQAMLCGPEEMTLAVRETLIDLGVPTENVHLELFETAGAARRVEPAADADTVCSATVVLHGVESTVDIREGELVLDAAKRTGLDVPFSCTGGVCATCRAHVKDGSVEMAVNYALEEDEIADGFVLTCQSTPTSDTLHVDYDQQ